MDNMLFGYKLISEVLSSIVQHQTIRQRPRRTSKLRTIEPPFINLDTISDYMYTFKFQTHTSTRIVDYTHHHDRATGTFITRSN